MYNFLDDNDEVDINYWDDEEFDEPNNPISDEEFFKSLDGFFNLLDKFFNQKKEEN